MTTPVAVQRQATRLRRFILFDAATTLASCVFVVVVALVAVDHPWLVVVAVLVAIGGLAMAFGLRPLARGDLAGALTWLAVANWGLALSCAAIAKFAWPITVLASLLPVVFAVPYVSPVRLRVFVAASFLVSVVAVTFGVLPDLTGLTEEADTWVKNAVLAGFIPFLSLLVIQAGLASTRELHATLDEALDVNDALMASRARVVAATDRERRRIERDLHDGAQQRLVGMSVQISMARETIHSDPDAAVALMGSLRQHVRDAQKELRELVRGVYPPVLTEHGLPAALAAIGDQLHFPVRVRAAEIGRFDDDVEAAVYFCVLEALQNAAKHAGDVSAVEVDLRRVGSEVVFEVADDGDGFDAADRLWGSGFVNMEDRLGAAGGSLDVTSAVGDGTTVVGRVPIPGEAPPG